MYSDEYDDSYDAESAAPPADVTPDDDVRRPFVTPRVFASTARKDQEESEDDSEPEEVQPQPSSSRNKLDFCVNPEEVRARREAAFQARRGRGAHRPPPKTANVVGKPKGQGQEKDVLISREKKEKNKSSRANHNRRGAAQWKRSQGMMPS
ncbi:hypothetical protein NE865_10683 [Phthorimaea operculella]|nr:hypothetical protein NE865_10683 [Phthorimaea operculella]